MEIKQLITDRIYSSLEVKKHIMNDDSIKAAIADSAEICISVFRNGGKVLFCGNGGSAADAQHLAAEFSGRFYYDRKPLFSEALHVNTSYLTAVANDYSFEEVYARLVEAKGEEGDILFALSTSGNSPNIIRAARAAHEKKMTVIGMTGQSGGLMRGLCDLLINVPSTDTPRIQEAHILIGHIICEIVESTLFPKT